MAYLNYWGLFKNPFDSVPDPGMYFRSHDTVETTVSELLFAIDEGNECLAVVVGEVGLGKTMALRVVLNALNPDDYRIAFITNPDLTFIQLLREIVGQLKGEPCLSRTKEALLEEFNRLLFESVDSGRKVLIFIDEGNAMRTANLESLRLLTNMQEDTRNLFTLVLAGQPKLGRMLERPSRANLFQRIGVYSRLEPLGDPAVVRHYVDHRMELAGCERAVFTDSAIEAIYERSRGVPRLINRLCKLSLKAGETNQLITIDSELVGQIAARFEPSKKRKAQRQAARKLSPLQASLEEPDLAREGEVESIASTDHESSEAKRHDGTQARPDDEFPAREEPENGAAPVALPEDMIRMLRATANSSERRRLAGQLAAKELTDHPNKYRQVHEDPVHIWDIIRTSILRMVG